MYSVHLTVLGPDGQREVRYTDTVRAIATDRACIRFRFSLGTIEESLGYRGTGGPLSKPVSEVRLFL